MAPESRVFLSSLPPSEIACQNFGSSPCGHANLEDHEVAWAASAEAAAQPRSPRLQRWRSALHIYTELSKITWETIGVRLSTCGQQHNIEVSVSLLFYNGIIKTNHCTVHHLNDSSLHWARSIINFGGALKESQANTTLYREGPFPKNRKGAFTYRDSKPLVFSLQSFERIWEVACNVQ